MCCCNAMYMCYSIFSVCDLFLPQAHTLANQSTSTMAASAATVKSVECIILWWM